MNGWSYPSLSTGTLPFVNREGQVLAAHLLTVCVCSLYGSNCLPSGPDEVGWGKGMGQCRLPVNVVSVHRWQI